MPEISKSFTIEAPPEETWSYLTDMENFASHLPGFEEFEEIDESTSYWVVKIDLSMFTKELTFKVEVLEEEYPRAAFTLDPVDQPADGGGSVEFEALDDEQTEITLDVESEASGKMAPFLNKVIEKALRKVTDQFAENVESASIRSAGS
jgi:carbon monoxide dehydrogenase subunit G